MESVLEQNSVTFVERRGKGGEQGPPNGIERRQFTASVVDMRPEVAELAQAVDRYKLLHRRRFITYEELHSVITQLGYHK
uniref:Uncharacterized protein n=1 Tax=Schlesneria paludicola TaxID=360056 RepID=A0A7C4QQ35_9PLAN